MSEEMKASIEEFVNQLQERALTKLKKNNPEYRDVVEELREASGKIDDFLKDQEEEVVKLFEDYLSAQVEESILCRDCLYWQGIKDGIQLMKLLGVM